MEIEHTTCIRFVWHLYNNNQCADGRKVNAMRFNNLIKYYLNILSVRGVDKKERIEHFEINRSENILPLICWALFTQN